MTETELKSRYDDLRGRISLWEQACLMVQDSATIPVTGVNLPDDIIENYDLRLGLIVECSQLAKACRREGRDGLESSVLQELRRLDDSP